MKEKLTKKDKIVYALIVALGILVTVVATVLLAKTERADAAEAIPNITEFDTCTYERFSQHMAAEDYLIVTSEPVSNNRTTYRYMFFTENPVFVREGNDIIVYPTSGVLDQYYLTKQTDGSYTWTGAGTGGTKEYIVWESGSRVLLGSNFAFPSEYAEYPQFNIDWYSSKIEYTYTYSGNLYTDLQYFALSNPESSGWEEIEDLSAKPVEERYLRIGYDAGGIVPDYAAAYPADSFAVDMEFLFYLPSKQFVNSWIANGTAEYELMLPAGRKAFFTTADDGINGVGFEVSIFSVSTNECHGIGSFENQLSPADLIAAAEESMGMTFQEYYGMNDSLWEQYHDIIYAYIVVYEFNTRLFAKQSSDVYIYGGLSSYYLGGNYSQDNLMSTYVEKSLEDITDADVEAAEKEKLEELLGDTNAEIEDLRNQIAAMQDTMTAYDTDLDSTEIWGSFKSLSNGLMSAGNSFKAITNAAGNVLGFLPGEVQAALYFGFIAIIIIGVIKAIRG